MSKLTLSVDPEVVSEAKRYAKDHGTSISKLVEAHLADLARPPAPDPDAPILRKLRGALKRASIEDYHKYLEDKYL